MNLYTLIITIHHENPFMGVPFIPKLVIIISSEWIPRELYELNTAINVTLQGERRILQLGAAKVGNIGSKIRFSQ